MITPMVQPLCLTLLAALPAALASPTAPQEGQASPGRGCQERGELPWFEGTWEELLAEAQETQRLVFVDFWTRWCAYCKKHDSQTFRDDAVLKEMRDVLCYSVDAELARNLPIVERFAPRSYPTLLVLESDGRLRDKLIGFLAPVRFVEEIRRIKRNESTLGSLRERIATDPADVEARYELALKLKQFGDRTGFREQVAAIREHDPEGRSLASRRLRFGELRRKAEATLRTEALYTFLEEETDEGLLFDGWLALWQLEDYLEKVAHTEEDRARHRKRVFAAARRLWPHVSPKNEYFVHIGNNIAFSFYQGREHLTAKDLAWALDIAHKVAAVANEDAYVLDTLACCLYAVGLKDEAIEKLRRCIELEPGNVKWKERLREFGG
jgi:thiol-disulfide isomerase/thioredoxin